MSQAPFPAGMGEYLKLVDDRLILQLIQFPSSDLSATLSLIEKIFKKQNLLEKV
jgi:hypothetical protein